MDVIGGDDQCLNDYVLLDDGNSTRYICKENTKPKYEIAAKPQESDISVGFVTDSSDAGDGFELKVSFAGTASTTTTASTTSTTSTTTAKPSSGNFTCGKPRATDRIVGGKHAEAYSIPWQVCIDNILLQNTTVL